MMELPFIETVTISQPPVMHEINTGHLTVTVDISFNKHQMAEWTLMYAIVTWRWAEKTWSLILVIEIQEINLKNQLYFYEFLYIRDVV